MIQNVQFNCEADFFAIYRMPILKIHRIILHDIWRRLVLESWYEHYQLS